MGRQEANRRTQSATDPSHDLRQAIANLADAVRQYCEQQPEAVRSYPFAPSSAEREAVRRLVAKGRSNQDWKAAINVDMLARRDTRWIRVEMPSSAEFVGKFTCPKAHETGFQGDFTRLEIRESQT
ncbi:MAG: hypothetical protein ACYSWU_05030 [Planctomycetota bacterium]|jgi:hypothetical protein